MSQWELALELLYQQMQELSKQVGEIREELDQLKKKINIYE